MNYRCYAEDHKIEAEGVLTKYIVDKLIVEEGHFLAIESYPGEWLSILPSEWVSLHLGPAPINRYELINPNGPPPKTLADNGHALVPRRNLRMVGAAL